MSTERELDVIERMVKAYLAEWTRTAMTNDAMLAAVRELRSILQDHDRISAVADLRDIITAHEQRAGGKGE